MPLLSSQASRAEQIRARIASTQRSGHRTLLLLCGSPDWSHQVALSVLALYQNPVTWQISEDSRCSASIRPAHLAQLLGQECTALIWDGFSGINPDGLAAAAGLIKASGLMILRLPPLSKLLADKDPDYLRMCADSTELKACSSFFLHRLYTALAAAADTLQVEENQDPDLAQHLRELPSIPATSGFKPQLPTTDQCLAIDTILAPPDTCAPSPILLSAARGRGKSTTLGIAIARLMQASSLKIILSAASKQNASIALLHFEREFARLNDGQPPPHRLQFCAPDTLIRTLPECDVLFIDEAAMLPVPLLNRLARHYPRCILATTTAGYEGTGQGFAIRFLASLHQFCRPRRLELNQAIRWAEDDPLERAINQALLLNTFALDMAPIDPALESTKLTWLAPSQLAENEALLGQLIQLLSEAHYQTRPADLRMLMDHPRIRIAVIKQGQRLLAALVLMAEGGFFDPALAAGLIDGTRRPRGHMIPQALTQFSGDASWLHLRSLRVMRIAVQAELSRQKLGSRLLVAAGQKAQAEGFDYLSTSFGLTEHLLPFWRHNHFQLLRIGYRMDAASACYSAHMLQCLTPVASTLAAYVRQRFAFIFQQLTRSHFSHLGKALVEQLQQNLPRAAPARVLNTGLLKAFSEAHRPFEDTLPELLHLLTRNEVKAQLHQLPLKQQTLLDVRLLEHQSWQQCAQQLGMHGKKEAEQTFRSLVGDLQNHI